MKKLLAVGAIVAVGMSLVAGEVFAGRGGGQRGMRGRQSFSPYAYSYQMWGMQQQQMRNRHRHRFGGFGPQNGFVQQPGIENGLRSYQPGFNYQGSPPPFRGMQPQTKGRQEGMGNQNRMMLQQRRQNGAARQAGNGAQNRAGQKNMKQNQLRGDQPDGGNQ